MAKKIQFNTKTDYNPDLVALNARRLSEGLDIITEGSPEYKNVIKRLKIKSDARRTMGVLAIQEIANGYSKDEKSIIRDGVQAIGIEPGTRKKEESILYV